MRRRVRRRASGPLRRSPGRSVAGALALAGALTLAACGDAGPGAWSVSVSGPAPVGAALLEVRGERITGFEGSGDARVYVDPTPQASGMHRLVVVSRTGAAAFRIRVDDVSAPAPAVTLVAAADASNLPLSALASFDVRVAR